MLHRDLRKHFPNYPIGPWGALGRVLTPVYALGGFWSVHACLADLFAAKARTTRHAAEVPALVIAPYLIGLTSILASGWLGSQPDVPSLALCSLVVWLPAALQICVWIRLTVLIRWAIQLRIDDAAADRAAWHQKISTTSPLRAVPTSVLSA